MSCNWWNHFRSPAVESDIVNGAPGTFRDQQPLNFAQSVLTNRSVWTHYRAHLPPSRRQRGCPIKEGQSNVLRKPLRMILEGTGALRRVSLDHCIPITLL
ncbi:hypothetical protein LIA77_00312 [Sarocladium implicatum]|nr:hypothetical protein LIA77_00312 [Sarocladium implicatum]